MSCCQSCATGARCESDCEAVDVHVGDFGSDFLNVLRTVDDVVSVHVIEPTLDALSTTPLGAYTQLIDTAHTARRTAQERAAPRTGPGAVPGYRASPNDAAALPASVSPTPLADAAAALASTSAPSAPVSPLMRSMSSLLTARALRGSLAASLAVLTPRAKLARAQRTVRESARGDIAATERLRAWKTGRDAMSRQMWAAAVRVMRDDRAAIERAARGAA